MDDTRKGTLLLTCVAPKQQCTMLLLNLMMIARFIIGKGIDVQGRLYPGQTAYHEDSDMLANELLQDIVCLKGIAIGFSKECLLKSYRPHLTPVMNKIDTSSPLDSL